MYVYNNRAWHFKYEPVPTPEFVSGLSLTKVAILGTVTFPLPWQMGLGLLKRPAYIPTSSRNLVSSVRLCHTGGTISCDQHGIFGIYVTGTIATHDKVTKVVAFLYEFILISGAEQLCPTAKSNTVFS